MRNGGLIMDLNNIIEEARIAQNEFILSRCDSKAIVDDFKNYIDKNFDLLQRASEIDKNEILSKEKVLQLFEVSDFEDNKTDAFQNEFGNVGKLFVPYGVLGVLSNSDVFTNLRLIILSVLTKNSMIFNIENSLGANYFVIQGINDVLQKYGVHNLFQIYNNNAGEHLEESEKLDGIVFVGKKANYERIKISSAKPVIFSGCGNYEIYIEDALDRKVISEILKTPNVKVYSKKGLGFGQEVSGLEEAMLRINETGSEYASGIITESRDNAKIFVNNIKSRNLFVNAAPTLMDNKLDIEAQNLMYKKSVLVYE